MAMQADWGRHDRRAIPTMDFRTGGDAGGLTPDQEERARLGIPTGPQPDWSPEELAAWDRQQQPGWSPHGPGGTSWAEMSRLGAMTPEEAQAYFGGGQFPVAPLPPAAQPAEHADASPGMSGLPGGQASPGSSGLDPTTYGFAQPGASGLGTLGGAVGMGGRSGYGMGGAATGALSGMFGFGGGRQSGAGAYSPGRQSGVGMGWGGTTGEGWGQRGGRQSAAGGYSSSRQSPTGNSPTLGGFAGSGYGRRY